MCVYIYIYIIYIERERDREMYYRHYLNTRSESIKTNQNKYVRCFSIFRCATGAFIWGAAIGKNSSLVFTIQSSLVSSRFHYSKHRLDKNQGPAIPRHSGKKKLQPRRTGCGILCHEKNAWSPSARWVVTPTYHVSGDVCNMVLSRNGGYP